MALSAGNMRIPIPEDPNFVGRKSEMEHVTRLLLQKRARVLVQGPPGMGKDALVAQVLRSPQVHLLQGLELVLWVQGTTDETLRRQLLEGFRKHHRDVLAGATEEKDQLQRIRAWLASHKGWLIIVEDGTWQCKALMQCIPIEVPHGQMVMTSKELCVDVAEDDPRMGGGGQAGDGGGGVGASTPKKENEWLLPSDTQVLQLTQLSTNDSVGMWRKMRVLAKSPSTAVSSAEAVGLRDDELKDACDARGGGVSFVPAAAPDETAEATALRHRDMAEALRGWGIALPVEKEKFARQRLRKAECERRAEGVLESEEVRKFLSEDLGNLPLSVRLVGHMLWAGEQGLSMDAAFPGFA